MQKYTSDQIQDTSDGTQIGLLKSLQLGHELVDFAKIWYTNLVQSIYTENVQGQGQRSNSLCKAKYEHKRIG